MDGRHDIETPADCERLVRAFYGRVLDDPIIGFIFTDVAQLDLEEHIPKVASFWETLLLGIRSYGGGAFGPHVALHLKTPLRIAHFQRWLMLWRRTVDELFAGERAELAKSHAERVAQAFHGRLQGVPSDGPPTCRPVAPDAAAPLPAGLPLTVHGPASLAGR